MKYRQQVLKIWNSSVEQQQRHGLKYNQNYTSLIMQLILLLFFLQYETTITKIVQDMM